MSNDNVLVKSRYWKTDVYHTEMCSNAERIRKIDQMPQDKAEDLGLHECMLCGDTLPEQNHDRRSLRYALQTGEVDYAGD